MTPIAFLRQMLDNGMDLDTAMRAAETFEQSAQAEHDRLVAGLLDRLSVDAKAEKRRQKDRERKRGAKGTSDGIPRNSAESAETTECKKVPEPLKNNPPSPPLKGGISPKSSASPRQADDIEAAFNLWNDLAAEIGLSRAKDLTPSRRTALRQRLGRGGLAEWGEAIAAIRASAFLRGQKPGRDGRTFRADLDFLLQAKSFQRVVEGFYGTDAEETKPIGASADDDPWPSRLKRWRLAGYWNTEWGPKPDKPGYLGPAADLAA